MKYRLGYEAVITVQRARIHPPELHAASAPSTNPYVHIGIMVPKGSEDVTVPTDCVTKVLNRTNDPIWNQTFCLPVMPNSDVLVMQVFDQRSSALVAPHLAAKLSGLPAGASQRITPLSRTSDSSSAEGASSQSSVSTIYGRDEKDNIPRGELIGVCLLPVARITPGGKITRHAMEIFPRPTEPSVGRLYVATKMETKSIVMLTQNDLKDPTIIGRFHSTRLLAAESRFLGIGELAAFLFEEGYSKSPQENWDHAVIMLAEQLAFRMFQIMSADKEDKEAYRISLNDEANFERAKARILKEGGLWDGL